MLIILKKDSLSELLKTERIVQNSSHSLIRAIADIRKNRLAIDASVDGSYSSLAEFLINEGSNVDDLYDLTISDDGRIFFACKPQTDENVKDTIQHVVDTWLIFDKKTLDQTKEMPN